MQDFISSPSVCGTGQTPSQDFVLFGGKGGAEVVADFVLASGRDRVHGFLNDQEPTGSTIAGYAVLGGFEAWGSCPDHVLFNAPLHVAKDIQFRMARILDLGIPAGRWGRAIHPRAAISPNARIGHGSSIGAFSDIYPSATIGAHVALRSSVFVAHDATIEDFTFIGSHATALGYTHLGKGAHIGPNSVIKEYVKIGAFAVVGLGSVVLHDVEPYTIVAGVPARKIGMVERFET